MMAAKEDKPQGVYGWLSCIGVVVVGARTGALYGPELGWTAGAALGVVCWVVHSWYSPLADCWWWWCKGKPKRRTKRGTGKTFHMCLICDGSGRRRRFLTAVTGLGLGRI